MKYINLYENFIDNHVCKECGWQGTIEVKSNPTYVGTLSQTTGFVPLALWKDEVMVCPQCQTENDVWTDKEPLRHKIKSFMSHITSLSVNSEGEYNSDNTTVMESVAAEDNYSPKDYLLLYHSTDSEHFTESNPHLAAKKEQYFNPLGEGIYFSTNREFTRKFGRNLYCYFLSKKSNIKVVTEKKWEQDYNVIMKGVLKKFGFKYDNLTLKQKVELNRLGRNSPISSLNEFEDYLEMEFDVKNPQKAITDFVTARNAKYDAVWYRDTDYYLTADEIVVPHHKFNPEYFKRIS